MRASEYERAAAQRVLGLQRDGELDVDFARRIGVGQQYVYNWRNGAGISLGVLAIVVRETGADLHALVFGEGPPEQSVPEQAFAMIADIALMARERPTALQDVYSYWAQMVNPFYEPPANGG